MNCTTVYRMLETLRRRGFASLDSSEKYYRLSSGVRLLGEGFTHVDNLCRIVAPVLGSLLVRVSWPSDFATFEQGAMVICETTHPFSPYSVHRAMIGRTRPLTRSALGRAVLSAASPDQRWIMLDMAINTRQPDAVDMRDERMIERMLAEIAKLGYSWSIDGS